MLQFQTGEDIMELEVPSLPKGVSLLSTLLATLPLAGEGQVVQHLRVPYCRRMSRWLADAQFWLTPYANQPYFSSLAISALGIWQAPQPSPTLPF